jgi:hypothetical protein
MPMTTTMDVGQKLVELCKQGKSHEAMETLYSPDIVAIEAGAPPGQSAETRGLAAVIGKSKWWQDNHDVHATVVDGPYPNGNRFAVKFSYDVTFKPASKRFTMNEIAVYTVEAGKITREEFFYTAE